MNLIKITLIILIISFADGINYSQYKNQLSLKQHSSLFIDTTKSVRKLTEKEPALAGFLSFIAPGFALGQLYNGEQGKFITHAIIGVTCLSTFIISAHFIVFDLNPGGNTSDHNEKNNSNIAGALLFFSAVIFAGNYIITIADAIVSASNINKKVRLQKYRSESTNEIRLGFSLDQNKKLRLNFGINL
jgi:hypothetical protein